VDPARDISEFLTSRRAKVTPEQYDRGLTDLVGELSTRSAEFRTRWGAHNVRFHRTGTKRIHHPVVGTLELSYETLELAADTGLVINVYTAEPGSETEQALNLLGTWAATLAEEHATVSAAPAPGDTDRL
jgi:hypothetical protein